MSVSYTVIITEFDLSYWVTSSAYT